MKTLYIMMLIAVFTGLGFQTSLLAEGPKGAPTAQELGKTALRPGELTDQVLDNFIRVDRRVHEVQMKANREIFRILDEEGLSVEKYTQIAQAISQDEALLKKVQDKISKILEEEQKAGK